MGYCVFCEVEKAENWFGSFCTDCRKIKNLGNVYGFKRTLEILEKCCIRNPNQLENKITIQKKIQDDSNEDDSQAKQSQAKQSEEKKPITRSTKSSKSI